VVPVTPLTEAAAEAPTSPGVYFVLGERRGLLYIGKAGNLRRRLQQHARPGAGSSGPRVDALRERVREIRWEEHPDEDSAAAREADLIVALQPALNASIAEEGRWAYVVVHPSADADAARFCLAVDPGPQAAPSYGCFAHLGVGVSSRPGIACSDGYAALLRLLWASSATSAGCHFPRRIAGPSPPNSFVTMLDPSWRVPMHAFFSGTSNRFLAVLAETSSRFDSYRQPGLRRDRQLAESFFHHGPAALRRLRLRHGRPSGVLARAEIVDLLAAEVRASIGDFTHSVGGASTARVLGRHSSRSRAIRETLHGEA
jgi:predicted GIY-YIG superfamily endonuclease